MCTGVDVHISDLDLLMTLLVNSEVTWHVSSLVEGVPVKTTWVDGLGALELPCDPG